MNLSRGFIVVSVPESFRDAPDCVAPLFPYNTVINIIIIMKTKTIQNVSTEGYKSPALNTLLLASEGVLCDSVNKTSIDDWNEVDTGLEC